LTNRANKEAEEVDGKTPVQLATTEGIKQALNAPGWN
jgi:hypothetical protein